MLQKIKPYILILPALLVTVILFFGGLFLGFIQSLGLWNISGNSSFTFGAYRWLFTSSDFLNSLRLTLTIATASTIAAGIISMLLIYILFILGENKSSRLLRRILQIPLLVPHITAAYLIGLLFMKSGWISSLAYYLGLIKNIESFPSIVNDVNSFGIVITYIWKEVPFIMLMLIPIVQRIEASWLEVARIYGAFRKEFFKEVLLPLLVPTCVSSMLIVFAFTLADFEVPYFLGVTYPKFVSVYAYDIYFNGELILRPLALAANFILVVITAILGILAYKAAKKWDIQKEMRW